MSSFARTSAIAGAIFWITSVFFRLGDSPQTEVIERVILFGALVIVPLGLPLVATSKRNGGHALPYRLAVACQPVGAVAVFVSLLMQKGLAAGLISAGWLVIDALLAVFGLWRLAQRGLRPLEEFSIDAGLLYPIIGGVSLVLYQFDVQVFGFGATIILLTAVHFHFAGFAAPIIGGLTGRFLRTNMGINRESGHPARLVPHSDSLLLERERRRPARVFITDRLLLLGLGLISSSVPIVAAGINFSPLLAFFGALMISAGLFILALLTIVWVLRLIGPIQTRVLLIISAVSSVAAMILASLYAYSIVTRTLILNIPTMAATHGVLNAFGLVGCGMLAWSIIQPQSRTSAPGLPFSKLPSLRFAGPHYFDRVSAVDRGKPRPRGLVDTFAIYEREDFRITQINSSIRAFYEQTHRYALEVTPHWKTGFRLGGRLMHWLGSRLGQLSLPIAVETETTSVDSRLVPVSDAIDGRSGVRGWIRTYTGGETAMYVAAYSTHMSRGVTYMNIAFPLPLGNLSSILHISSSNHGGEPGIVLSTLSRPDPLGDQGIYFSNSLLPIRLPMNEVIAVWVDSNGELKARHDMWLLGINFLTLDYDIRPRK